MNNVAEKVPYQDCCGCGACFNTCAKGAISMVENHEGFKVPVVDAEKCTNCGMCVKVCPALNEKRANFVNPDCYAAQADDAIRAVSSSGGAFTIIAEEILKRGGYVCGAAFRDDWSIHHIIVKNNEDLAKLRGSKYVQSDTEDCFKRIKALLRDGKWVLFSGTPCQVAGLYTYLGKEYDTLLTVDIFCHGAPSPGVWRRYLKENYAAGEILKINFRDKTAIGWSCSHVAITTTRGKKDVSNNYTQWFHHAVIMRPSCQNCKFSKLPKPADISLGDWWGISKVAAHLNDGKGLSNVLLNSEKGRKFYENLAGFKKSEKLSLPPDYNNAHMRHGLILNKERPYFFANNVPLNNHKQTEETMRGYYDVCYVSNYYAKNYGSMLVHYAGAKILEMLGFSVLMLNRPTPVFPHEHEEYQNVIPNAFAHRHYKHISPNYKNVAEMAELNNHCSAYVVGSDQLFEYYLDLGIIAHLPFARKDKLKIAFGTSFGHDRYPANRERLMRDKSLLQRFDYLALRETPENLLKNVFEIKATRIPDPTLILPREFYYNLAETATNLDLGTPYLLTYILDLNKEKEDAVLHIAKKLGLRIINIASANPVEWKHQHTKLKFERNYTPEEFLRLYRDASFVVTDSFHGTCFSIIFRKKFISLINYFRGLLRYRVFENCNIKHRFYDTPRKVFETESWMEDVDYSSANKVLEKESLLARKWLARVLRRVKWQRFLRRLKKNESKARDFPETRSALTKVISKIKGWFYREKTLPNGEVYKRILFFSFVRKKNP